MSGDLDAALRILRQGAGDRVRTRVPLAPLTTFRVGGPAALYLEPEREEDLALVSRAVGEAPIPFTVIGKGSNVLVSDEGFAGLVLRLGKGYRWAARDRRSRAWRSGMGSAGSSSASPSRPPSGAP